MKWPSFLKFNFPKWNFQLPQWFQRKTSFYSAWKKFLWQIPPESRSIVKSYQHFIVLGTEKSGKTDLIQGLINQSQDLYPFDTTYTENPDVQFYIGPRQVVEEMSYATLENRTIKGRKQVIRLWKKLYAKHDPIVVVAFNAHLAKQGDVRELNKFAQFIGGKISLLTEIRKKPIKLRIALTHLDAVPGYLEFARFLKQQNISYTLNLSSNFESNTLSTQLKAFAEEHLSLILTSVSHEAYNKILHFFKELPLLFPLIEEFLRALISRVSFKESIEPDVIALTSHQEDSSSFSVFQWTKLPSTAIFFRYPMLKHQIAAGIILTGCISFLVNSYFHTQSELLYVQKGTELLDLLQFPAFQQQIVSGYEGVADQRPRSSYLPPHFFQRKMGVAKNQLAHRIRKHLIEPEFRRAILENKGEFKHLYFLGLMQATAHNHMGKFIYKNADHWAKTLGLEENLIKIYITSCSHPVPASQLTESKVSPFLPLTSLEPWLTFLKKFKEVTDKPFFLDQPFEDEDLLKETDKLFAAISRLRNDPLVFAIGTLLDEAGFKQNENIKTICWVGENIDALENFLLFIRQTSVPNLNVQGMNLTQFFTKLKEISLLTGGENELYNLTLLNQSFSFDSSQWTNHIIVHNIERALQDYITLNADTNGAIFFVNTADAPEPSLAHLQEISPVFNAKVANLKGYCRADFEKKVRSPAEKLVSFVDSLPINPEEKKRFGNFLTREAINYIKSYQDRYATFFDTYDVKINSTKALKKMLTELTKSSSFFYDFLKTIQTQTSVFCEPILSLKNTEELNNFAFLDTILSHQDGQAAPITEYQKLMGDLLEELNTPVPSSDSFLSPHLTPAAHLSLSILQNNPSSYHLRVQECLLKMEVPERFHRPFQQPVVLAHKIGLAELKSSLEHLWHAHFSPKVEPLLSQFPFNARSTEIATLRELEEVLSPRCEFFHHLQEMLAICSMNVDHLHLSEPIYQQLSQIAKISQTLWDTEGTPKPIILKVRSIPFSESPDHLVPALSYITTGGESVYNFNQDPSWQSLKVEWWQPDAAYIGMELLNKSTNTRSYRTVQGPSDIWSFFTLLRQARMEENNTWSWQLPTKEGTDARAAAFHFEQSPYDIFKIGDHP